MILQSSYISPLKGHKHTKQVNFMCFPNSPAAAHTFQHNPEPSQTTLVKISKGYACSY